MLFGSVKSADFMVDHRLQTGIGMIGAGSPCSAPETAIEAFQSAGGAQVEDLPVRMAFVDGKVSDGRAEVGAEATDCLGL